MIKAHEFIEAGRKCGFNLYTGVPCSYLKPFINYVIHDETLDYVAAANEGDAVAIASGASLGKSAAVAMFQNSGLGNAVNPLTSLNYMFKIPILLIVTWRGEPGTADEPQHELMGEMTPDLLDRMRIAWELFPRSSGEIDAVWRRAGAHMDQTGLPYALVMRKGSVAVEALRAGFAKRDGERLARPVVKNSSSKTKPTRYQALKRLLAATPLSDWLIVSTTGYASRELFAVEDRINQLYMVGSMGCVSSLALGLAIRHPNKKVLAIDGDGALLMRLGQLATNGFFAPKNFVHLVLDNGVHESTGSQETVSGGISFGQMACAAGYRRVWEGDDLSLVDEALRAGGDGPVFASLKICKGTPGDLPRPGLHPSKVKERFKNFIVCDPASIGVTR